MSPGAVRNETGAATLLTAFLSGLLVFVTLAGAAVVGVVATHRRAQAAADLAALAGAGSAELGRDPCASASRVASANGGRLIGCRISGLEVSVVTEVRGPGPLRMMHLRARARAGPVGLDDLS